ncbi:MAG: hypothetical protein N3E40_01780, partial [Dehalococcoidia bacterium]|nr:hypothetical protein [Dehalococcoidia bacterium]
AMLMLVFGLGGTVLAKENEAVEKNANVPEPPPGLHWDEGDLSWDDPYQPPAARTVSGDEIRLAGDEIDLTGVSDGSAVTVTRFSGEKTPLTDLGEVTVWGLSAGGGAKAVSERLPSGQEGKLIYRGYPKLISP